jgi:hypothetical protein
MIEPSESAFSLIEDGAVAHGLRIRDSDVAVTGGYVSHAIDAMGRRHILIPLASGERPIADRHSQGVSVSPRDLEDAEGLVHYIDVACEEGDLRDLFAIFCDE